LSVSNYYELTLQLLDKTQNTPTPINLGRISGGDLSPYRSSLTLTNTGNSKTDSGVLQLRIPPDGTFVRTEPILTNEESKDRFVIQAQIRQADGSGGVRKGKIFRFIIGTPIIDDSVGGGENLTLNLLPIEYRTKEHLQSNQLYFLSPKDSFEQRLSDYNSTKGSDNPELVFNTSNIDLPDNDELKQNWLPTSPKDTHGLLHDVISRLSLPSTSGGTFTDYYFDMESKSTSGNISSGNINEIDIIAEPFGEQDSGVVLDPLSVISPVDAEENKTVMSDMQRFKNHVILEGSPRSGSLPMERTKFNSAWQHAQVRPVYTGGTVYYDGSDGIHGQSLVKIQVVANATSFTQKGIERFFKYVGTNNVIPSESPVDINQTSWYEDFTTIPEYSNKAQYEEFEIITKTTGSTIEFFQLMPIIISQVEVDPIDFYIKVTTAYAHGLNGGERISITGSKNFNLRKTDLVGGVKLDSSNPTTVFTVRISGVKWGQISTSPAETTSGNKKIYLLGRKTHYKGDPDPVNTANGGWDKIMIDTTTSQYKPFWSYTPWTSNYDLQESNLSGVPLIPEWDSGTDYIGQFPDALRTSDEVQYNGKWYIALNNSTNVPPDTIPAIDWHKLDDSVPTWAGNVPDWNLERANFDREESADQFEQISMKAVYRVVTSSSLYNGSNGGVPTTVEKQNGARFLLNGASNSTWGGTDFSGNNNNKIVEWYQPLGTTGEWKYSILPKPTQNEMVVDLSTGNIFGWDGTNWEIKWNSQKPTDALDSSPFHCVSNGNLLSRVLTDPIVSKMGFGLITGATQIPAQAIRLLYHWDTVWGSKLNFSSRGAWYAMHLPMPRKAMGSTAIGDIYKQSTLDTTNLDRNSKGGQGWNNGVDSEDLGRISALTMKVRLSGYDSTDTEVNGYANMPFKAWAIDVFGRIWFADFQLRYMGQYDHVRIAFGERAGNKLYHNRIDELFDIFGYTFSQDFFLKQKEFTGIQFDWRFVKSWGLFWNVGYDENGMYVAVRDNWMDTIKSWASQVWNSSLASLFQGAIPQERYIIDYVTLDIDELAFEKQMFANSDNTTISEPRTEFMSEPNEIDYDNLKLNAQAKKARKKFIPQQWVIKSQGDVRMRLGKKFKITGSRIPEQANNYILWSTGTTYNIGDKVKRSVGGVYYVYQAIKSGSGNTPETSPVYWMNLNESICQQVSHNIDSSGYTMTVTGVRKFVYSE
jgi:hypothetical protein